MAGGNQVIDIALQTDPQRVNFNLQNSGGSVSFDLSNGSDMSSRFIDDTAGADVTNKTWSANKLTEEFADKADKTDTVLDTTLSRGRKANTTVGEGSIAFGKNAQATGKYSYAFGEEAKAQNDYAFTEGYYTHAFGQISHAEGSSTTASGLASHAEGGGTLASGQDSHSEGNNTRAQGSFSHAEGVGNTASGNYGSHAEGSMNTASGNTSHAEGFHTIANHKSQHVFGEYNIEDPNTSAATARGTYVEIVGNGTGDDARSNIRTLDWNGNENLAGDLTINKGTANEVSVSDLAEEVASKAEIDDTAGVGDSTKVWSADKSATEHNSLLSAIKHYDQYVIGCLDLSQNLEWVEGYSISSSGNPTQTDGFHYSSLIPVENKEYTLWYVGTGVNNNTRIHAYNSNGEWLRQVSVSASGTSVSPIEVKLNIEIDTKYIRISINQGCKIQIISHLIDDKTVYENITATKDRLNNALTSYDVVYNEPLVYPLNDNYLIIADDTNINYGKKTSGQGWQCSDFISCEKYTSIDISMPKRVNATDVGIVFYSDNDESNIPENCVAGYVCNYGASGSSVREIRHFEIPSGAKYFRTVYLTSLTDYNCVGYYIEGSDGLNGALIGIKQLQQEVGSIETYIDDIIGNREILNSISWVEDYSISDDGTISSNSNFHYTNLIPVKDGVYHLEYKGVGVNNNTRIHAYDANGDWIKQIVVSRSETSTDPIKVYIPCTNYSAIRISTAKVTEVLSLTTPSKIDELITQTPPIGLHTMPENDGVLNAIKRARQFTDIVWTPGADIERAFMDTGDTYLTSHSQTYKGTFKAGVKYKGLPYADKEYPYRWLGIEVPLEVFCSAIEKDNSIIAIESDYTQYGACYYGCVCTSLTAYAIDIPYTISSKYDKIPNITAITTVSANMDASLIKLGDLLQISGHAAIVTDIYKDKDNNVKYFEISEETRQGNSNREHKTGKYGSVCRRITMSVDEFKTWFNTFNVYRYGDIKKVTYRPCAYVPMPDEGDRICIHDYPLMPYEGNKASYSTDTTPAVKLIFDTDDYTTLVVYKDGDLFGMYSISGEAEYTVTCDTDEAKYTACLAVLDGSSNIVYSTQTVEWYCRPHGTPTYSISGGNITISVTNSGEFKPYCIIFDNTFRNGEYTRLFEGDYSSSSSDGSTTYSFQLPFAYSTQKDCKLYLKSDEWGVCEYNFTITP